MHAVALALLASCLTVCVTADLYLHSPRGSNNRLDEQNRNRDNANRLFDSQNNNKGGYNQNTMNYYSGSILQIEWTNQHSCSDPNSNCELILQYACDPNTTGIGIRDGQTTLTINPTLPNDYTKGRHESGTYYNECATRLRNAGLFTADQKLNGQTAKFTRQSPNGAQFGFECPEERDYYPYWHPSPWIDVAILTSNVTRCPYYQSQSQNVLNRGHCTGFKPPDPSNTKAITVGMYYNNQAACTGAGFQWLYDSAWNISAPVCQLAPWSRDNHLGNGMSGWPNTYNWTLPTTSSNTLQCVLRMRYNISTNDYDGWNTFSNKNGAASPIRTNPTVQLSQTGVKLQLAINTNQYGRTFQDRSSVFTIAPRPAGVAPDSVIYNLNVRGQRGNIVQNFPSVEYDFVPTILHVTTADYIHRQFSGSNTTPAGAGNGQENTDRSNFAQLNALGLNYPATLSYVTMVADAQNTGFETVRQWAMLNQNQDEQDDAAPHQDMGLMRYSAPATYYYMGTRNNDFSNRSQKGTIVVSNIPPTAPASLPAIAIAGIVIASTVVPAAAVVVGYGVVRPKSKIGQGLRWLKSKIRGVGSAQAPAGYMRA